MKIVDIYENMKDLIRRIIKEQTENSEKKKGIDLTIKMLKKVTHTSLGGNMMKNILKGILILTLILFVILKKRKNFTIVI